SIHSRNASFCRLTYPASVCSDGRCDEAITLSSPRLKERELRCVSKVENKAVCIRPYGGHGVSEKNALQLILVDRQNGGAVLLPRTRCSASDCCLIYDAEELDDVHWFRQIGHSAGLH